MPSLLILLIAQSSVVSTPATRHETEPRWIEKAIIERVTPVGSVDNPITVSKDYLRNPEDTIRWINTIGRDSVFDKSQSALNPISNDLEYGCRKVIQFAQGVEAANSKILNGMTTAYRCDGFVTDVTRQNFSRPLKSETATGFAPTQITAVVHGGALLKNFRQNGEGVRDAVYLWIGKSQSIELTLTTTQLSHKALEVRADQIIDTLTR